FGRDLARPVRYYRARGYYDADVGEPQIETHDDAVDVRVTIREGRPVRIRSLRVDGLDGLPADVRARLRQRMALSIGDRFDEDAYDAAKSALGAAMKNASYARAALRGEASVDPTAHAAPLA